MCSSLGSVNSENINPKGIDFIHSTEIPPEIVRQIFSCLSKSDFQTLTCVNWPTNTIVKVEVGFCEIQQMKNFVQALITGLNVEEHSEQIWMLVEIQESIASPNVANLLELKRYMLKVKSQLIDVIKTLDLDAVAVYRLEDLVQSPLVFEDFFRLAVGFREIDSIKNFIGDIIRTLNVEEHSEQIWMLVEIQESIASPNVANLLELERYMLNVKSQLVNVIKTLGWEAIGNLEDLVQPPLIFGAIFSLAELEANIDKSNRIWDMKERADDLMFIVDVLVQLGSLDRAIEVANSMPVERVKSRALNNICISLIRVGNRDRAHEVARAISCEDYKSSALRSIFESLKNAGEFDRALEVSLLFSGDRKSDMLRWLSEALARVGNFVKAFEVVKLLPDERTKSFALRKISTDLANKGNFDKAIEVAGSISCEDHKSLALDCISEALTKAGNFDKATEVAESIYYEDHKNSALNSISEALTKAGYVKRAMKVANSALGNSGLRQ